jgi:hypothetical protein
VPERDIAARAEQAAHLAANVAMVNMRRRLIYRVPTRSAAATLAAQHL